MENHCRNCSLSYLTWTEKWSACVSSSFFLTFLLETLLGFYPGTFLGFILVRRARTFKLSSLGSGSVIDFKNKFEVFVDHILHSRHLWVHNPDLCASFCTARYRFNFVMALYDWVIGEFPFYSSLIAGRFLIGIHSGITLCLLPVYFIETSAQAQRPFLSSLQVTILL